MSDLLSLKDDLLRSLVLVAPAGVDSIPCLADVRLTPGIGGGGGPGSKTLFPGIVVCGGQGSRTLFPGIVEVPRSS